MKSSGGDPMEPDVRRKLAALLRSAASQAVSEDDFWDQFNGLANLGQPAAALAFESATHYWGNFHQRNLFLIRVKPDPNQVSQGQDELNLIADALDQDWPISELKEKLTDI